MRTTLRIDDDLMRELKRAARKGEIPLTELVNRLLRRALASEGNPPRKGRYRETTFPMGAPTVALDKALALAADLEDREVREKLDRRK